MIHSEGLSRASGVQMWRTLPHLVRSFTAGFILFRQSETLSAPCLMPLRETGLERDFRGGVEIPAWCGIPGCGQCTERTVVFAASQALEAGPLPWLGASSHLQLL